MVVRKPTPADSFIPVSSSSRLPRGPSTPTSRSDKILATTLPQTTPDSSSAPYKQSNSRPDTRNELLNSFYVGPSAARPSTEEEASTAEPLPPTLQAVEASQPGDQLYPELPGILKPGSSASGKATPRSSLDSGGSRDFLEEVLSKEGASNNTAQLQRSPQLDHTNTSVSGPTTTSTTLQYSAPQLSGGKSSDILRSNNPFRRANSNNEHTPEPKYSLHGDLSPINNGYEVSPDSGNAINMTANLSLADRPFSEYSSSYHPSTPNLDNASQKQGNEQGPQMPSTSTSSQTSRPLPSVSSFDPTIDERQPPLIPISMEDPGSTKINSLQSEFLSSGNSPIQGITTEGSMRSGVPAGLEKELPATPQVDAFSSGDLRRSAGFPPAIQDQIATSTQGIASGELSLQDDIPPIPQPPKSSNGVVDAEIAKLRAQRNETYSIKHFNWICPTSRTMRRSSMLIQNQNGPCPLLALVNALILGAESDSRSALGTALRTREQVSLGLIIESLMDELTSEGRGGGLTDLPDVDELNRFLLLLHTGMTANPRLAPPAITPSNLMDARNSSLHLPLPLNNDRKLGTFEDTQNMRLYGAFAVPLVHGWLAPRSDPARAAFARSAPTYEDAQTIQFREEELEEKLSRVGLTAEEPQLLQDISSIKSFLSNHPNQLTKHGLDIISDSLFPGAFAILFRNDHFSTLYKHPDSGQLFTLVTDAGYSDKDEVIWESLVDVSGQNSEFFSGDFRPVGNTDTISEPQQGQRSSANIQGRPQHPTSSLGLMPPTSPQEQQQQADADFAMALQLQEEEEARMDDSHRHSDVIESATNRNSVMNNHRSREREGSRPAIPPRNTRNQGVNRPLDPNSDEAPPPAYEEAAKGKPYLPPLGHPQHPSFDGRSPTTSGPSMQMYPPGPRAVPSPPRRMSAFQESSQFHSTPPLTRQQTNNSIGVGQYSGRSRDRDKDCIVM